MKRLSFTLSMLIMSITISAQNIGGEIIRKQTNQVTNKKEQTISNTNDVIVVKTPSEFLKSIASNRTIIVDSPDPLKMTNEMVNMLNEGTIVEYELVDPKSSGLYADWADGPGIVFANINNLTIKGVDNEAEITVESAYCSVIRMVNCSNIVIEQMTLGHNEGTCGAPVVELEGCDNVSFVSSGLFGCGTEGFIIDSCNNITCKNSNIFQCSRNISTIRNSGHVKYTNCNIYDIRGGLIVEEGCNNILFEGCNIHDIDGELFKLIESEVTLRKCVISHDKLNLGSSSNIVFTECDWK